MKRAEVYLRTMMTSKIHRARVTATDLHYVGSITIDQELLDSAGLLVGQQVDVVDVTNGSRLTTYLIAGERGSGQICVNGAAAHHIVAGDLVIIVGYGIVDDEVAAQLRPRVVFVDEANRILEVGADPGQVPVANPHGLRSSGIALNIPDGAA